MGPPLTADRTAQLQAAANNNDRAQYYQLLAAHGADDQSLFDRRHPLRCNKKRSPGKLLFAKSQGLISARQCLETFNPKAE